MSDIQFSDNYHDLSTDNGFQFEFHCERCHDAWRSPFDRYSGGATGDVPGAADNLFGGIFGSARGAMDHVRGAGWQTARAAALRTAVQKAKGQFHRCPRCSNHYCDNCWNPDEGSCINCVPRLDVELAAIRREAKIARARDDASAHATTTKEDLQERAMSCRDCGAPAGRGTFCPECGTKA